MKINKNFRVSSDLKKIFQLSWPVMLGMVLQSLLGTVDMIYISKLGTNYLAAASLGISVTAVTFTMSSVVSAGTIALVSRSFGGNNMEKVRMYSAESFLLSLIIGVILSFLCYINTRSIIKLFFNPDNKVLDLSVDYLEILFLGTVFVFLNSALRTIMQAIGDTLTPLYIFGASNILNILLAPIMVFKLHMGIEGAAGAAVISTVFSFVFINYILIKKIYENSIFCFLKHMKLEAKSSIKILKIGGWACIQQVARPITGMLMVGLVYKVGNEDGSAAFGVGGQVFNYTFIFLVGLSTAIAIVIGQSLGRGDIEKCEYLIKEGMKLAIVNMIFFAIPYFIFPAELIGIFTKDANVINIGVAYLRIVYIGVLFIIFTTIYGGVFQGAGDTFPPMIASLIANVIVKLPIAYLLSITFNLGTDGVWIAVSVSVIIEALIVVYYFKKGKWKEKVL